jgi:catechol 2,3-dioxygenase-like lactoylglutathione lyase family enzyme
MGLDRVVLHFSDVARAKRFSTEILGMTLSREDVGQVFVHAGQQRVALFDKACDAPLTAGNDRLKAELERVSSRPEQERCIV